MKLSDLIANYRTLADDIAQPYRNDDVAVTAWLNEAQDEAAIRAKLIFDTSSPVASIAIVANTGVYTLDPSIIQVADAWLASTGEVLAGTDQSVLDRNSAMWPRRAFQSLFNGDNWPGQNWRTQTGIPSVFIQDGTRLQLVPIPTVADTLQMSVYRIALPTERMASANSTPVIAGVWHERLIQWALYRAYSQRDEEQNDDKISGTALELFEASFGVRPSADTHRRRTERRSNTTRINWP